MKLVLLLLAIFAGSLTLAAGVAAEPTGQAVVAGGSVSCLLGDVGCRFYDGTAVSMAACTPWDLGQPVTGEPETCTGTTYLPPTQTTVFTVVTCTFASPAIPPFPPPGFTSVTYVSDHGTAIERPDGSFVIHCPAQSPT